MIKNVKKTLVILVILSVMGLISGCSESSDVVDATVTASEPTTITDTPEESVEELVEESVEEVEIVTVEEATHQIITDMSGREVEIPTSINKVFSVNNNGTILLYTLCPEKLIGWNSVISDNAKSYMDPTLAELPMLGILYGNSSNSNPEEVMMSNPDVIIFMDSKADEKIVEAADKIQETLMIPVVVVKGSLTSYDKAYEFTGNILGETERASALIEYYQNSMNQISAVVDTIPEDQQVTVYYAREADGLSTETSKSPNAQLISLCGGINVAVSDEASIKSPIVSIEQVINWNPQIIFTGNAGFIERGTYQEIMTNPNWLSIDAVKEGQVFPTPQAPFNWFDRPPSVNRIIGLNYVLYCLYPDYYEGDIVAEVMAFYDLFYHYTLTESEAKGLLNIRE